MSEVDHFTSLFAQLAALQNQITNMRLGVTQPGATVNTIQQTYHDIHANMLLLKHRYRYPLKQPCNRLVFVLPRLIVLELGYIIHYVQLYLKPLIILPQVTVHLSCIRMNRIAQTSYSESKSLNKLPTQETQNLLLIHHLSTHHFILI